MTETALTAATAEDGSTVPDDYWDKDKKGKAKSDKGKGGSSTWDEEKHPRGTGDKGGEWVAKDEAGKQAQANTANQDLYRKLEGASPEEAAKLLKGLNDEQLRGLTQFAYSSKTSNSRVVKARTRVASEMGKRGIDITKHGARGGGKPGAVRASGDETAATVIDMAGRMVNGRWEFTPEPVTAAAGPVDPPGDWFTNPGLDAPTMLTIDDTGRVFGHVASWDVPHIGLPGRRTAPRSRSGYQHFLSGNVRSAEGDTIRTGHLTMATGHAALSADAGDAAAHYDNTGACFADVVCGEDAHGIWVAGAMRPDVTPEQVRVARGSSLSGDWRPIGGDLEMVAALSVNTPGFGIPQPLARVASGASQEVVALVAAGIVGRRETGMETDTITVGAPVRLTDDLVGMVASVGGDGRALVEVDVDATSLTLAGPEAVALMASAQRQRVRDREVDARIGRAEAVAASAVAQLRARDALDDLAVIPE